MGEKMKYYGSFLRNIPNAFRLKVSKKHKNRENFLESKNISMDYSSDILKEAIESEQPFAAVRFGAVELSCWNNYERIKLRMTKSYKCKVLHSIKNNAGVFPTEMDNLNFYSAFLLKMLPTADILGITNIHMEDYFCRKYCPQVKPIQYDSFDPLTSNWIKALSGKKVLVISPFEEDIRKQYLVMDKLFPKDIIPHFSLVTIEAVQTHGEAIDSRFQTWFEALDYMKMEILKKDFDIALIGAGAYGTPLCLFIKSLGKQAIQTGGATQILFGILGKRWENRPLITQYVNEYWIRPSSKIVGAEHIEDGCYW